LEHICSLASTQTDDLTAVYPKQTNTEQDVAQLAPEAGYLLTVAFPPLTLERAEQILTEIEGPGGGSLDNGTLFGVYSRLSLYAAAGRAMAFASGQLSSARPAIFRIQRRKAA
jgi:hypothetical protein